MLEIPVIVVFTVSSVQSIPSYKGYQTLNSPLIADGAEYAVLVLSQPSGFALPSPSLASVFDFTIHEVLYCQSASFDRHSVSSRIIVRLQARPKPPPQ